MATFTLRTAAGSTRDGLTVYQLQQLIRSGEAGGDDEVSSDGAFRKIRDVAVLARHLPGGGATASEGDEGATFIEVGGLRLEVGPDGRPLPPPPEVVASLLAAGDDRTDPARARRVRQVVLGVALVLFAVELFLLVRELLQAPPG